MNKKQWVFKHEPKTLDQMIVTDDKRVKLQKIITELPNTLISGKPGTGKGTFMNILLKETGCAYLKINGSLENGIDIIRERVHKFARACSFNGLKIVYINECLDKDEIIQVPGGELRLGDMEFGEVYDVFSIDMKDESIHFDTAEKIGEKIDEIYEIELENGETVKCNLEHKFFVYNRKDEIITKKLKELNENDRILISDAKKMIHIFGEKSIITEIKIKKIKFLKRGKVIDIEVKKNHNFILKNGVPNHNCERLSKNSMDSIKDLSESVEHITRFFFLANNEDMIIDALKSRCGAHLDLNDPPGKEIFFHLLRILKKEDVSVTANGKKAVIDMIKNQYPDIRKMIGTLQQNVIDDKIDKISNSASEDVYEKIFQSMIQEGDPDAIRKILQSNFINFPLLYDYFFQKVLDDPDLVKNAGSFIVETNEHQFRDNQVLIKDLNFIAYMLLLMEKDII